MKKLLLIIILSAFVTSNLLAQINTAKKVNNVENRNQKIEPPTPPSNTKTTAPVSTSNQNTNTTILSQPMLTSGFTTQKLPDLKINSLSIVKLNSRPETAGLKQYSFEVSYTIMNEGNAAADAKLVSVTGTIGYENANGNRPIAGCGSSLTNISGKMINPGATMSGSFRCYGVTLETSRNYIYFLTVDNSNSVPELNEQNNTAQISILFQ